MIVVKRNGTEVSFEKGKIHSALSRAFKEVYGQFPESKEGEELNSETNNVTADVVRRIKGRTIISVEEIQDVVEDVLMSYDHAVAKAYITYRFKHKIKRDISNTTDNVIMEMLGNKSEYWSSENSNKDSQLVTTQRDYIAGITSTDITKRLLLPRKVKEAHERGEIHFHDADYFIQPITNCCLVNLKDTLQNGTVMNKKAVNCPHRLWTATTISTQIITAVASSQYGGTSINLGHLAPFVRKSYEALMKKYERFDKFTQKIFAEADLRKEIEDSVQTFNYQINTMSTTNGQTPFISVFMYLSDEDGEYKKEMAMLIEEFLKQRIKGIQNEQGVWVTQEFPKLLYVLEKDNMKGGEYEYLTNLAAKCASFRLAPDFISEKKMIELKNGDVYGCMGCRSFLTVDRFTEKYGNIANAKNYDGKPKYWGRFNQGVVTISLPDVAFSSGRDINKFWELMEERTELCHTALKCRHEHLEGTLSDAAPILWQHGAFARLKKGEKIDELLHHGYSTISLGYAGLYEAVKYMTGHSHSDKGKGEAFGLQIMKFLNDKCNQWKAEEDIDYSPYGTPIESTTYRFAKCLKEKFGEDIFKKLDGHDRNYITNSYHVPVFEEVNPFEKLSIESKFQDLSTGGAVSYVEAANLSNNVTAVRQLIDFIYDNILYAEINVKSDYCMNCGYDGEIKIIDEGGKLDWECPNCGNRDHTKMSVARRTCGYIGANFWNQGRTNEIKDRYVHLDCHEA